jgi:FXSXX-COOH protein
MDDNRSDSDTDLLDLRRISAAQLQLLDENAPLGAVLAHSLRRAVQEVTNPTDIVVAKFDSSI